MMKKVIEKVGKFVTSAEISVSMPHPMYQMSMSHTLTNILLTEIIPMEDGYILGVRKQKS